MYFCTEHLCLNQHEGVKSAHVNDTRVVHLDFVPKHRSGKIITKAPFAIQKYNNAFMIHSIMPYILDFFKAIEKKSPKSSHS